MQSPGNTVNRKPKAPSHMRGSFQALPKDQILNKGKGFRRCDRACARTVASKRLSELPFAMSKRTKPWDREQSRMSSKRKLNAIQNHHRSFSMFAAPCSNRHDYGKDQQTMPVIELSNDDGARLALETSSGALEGGDESLALREGLDVLDAGLDLGQHGAGSELALGDVLASLGHGHRG